MPHSHSKNAALTAFEEITAMIAAGQLMRLAAYSASYLVLGDRYHISGPGRTTYFLCDVENPVPTPMPDLFMLERLCHHCAA
jgi:microcystin-dependent protein